MTTHKLKTLRPSWEEVHSGAKTFEVRWNDRNYQVGDELLLREWIPPDEDGIGEDGTYTGRQTMRTVSYVLKEGRFVPKDGFAILGLKPVVTTIYSRLTTEVRNAPATWIPGLLLNLIQAAEEKQVYRPGGFLTMAQSILDDVLAGKDTVLEAPSHKED